MVRRRQPGRCGRRRRDVYRNRDHAAARHGTANRPGGDRKTVAALGSSGIQNFTLTALDVSQVGPDTAREIGRFSLDAPGPKKKLVKVEGKYVVVWKQVGGKWLLDVDIWNLNK
jgi:ketosteroid isomerase-like protein